MIKTIDTSQITEEMFKAFRLGDDLSGKIFNLLEAAPEVKTRPIGTLFLGGIEGNEYGEIDVDLKSKALEALQEELVSSENPVVLEVYAHPPAVSEGWIRAIDEALVCHHIDVANADDSYAIAKDKLNKLLCVVQDIGAYFAKQEPARAVPGKCEPVAEVLWYEPMLHEPQTKKGHKIIDASLSWMEKAPLGTKLYTAPLTIDDETRKMVMELCEMVIGENNTDHYADIAREVLKKLEAGK